MRSLLLLSLVALLLLPQAAQADIVQKPIQIRALAEPRPVEAGEYFETVVEIAAASAVQVYEIRVEGEGWSQIEHDAPNMAQLDADGSLRFDLSGIPQSLDEPLRVSVLTDEGLFEKELSLRGWARDRAQRGRGRLLPLPAELAARVPDAPYDPSTLVGEGTPPLLPAPVDDPAYGQDPFDTDDPPAMGKVAKRNIHVQGRVLYIRDDGEIVGLYGATVRLYDEDTTWDEWLGTTTTDIYGNFSFDINWDPCWVCDSQPDLYVEAETENDFIEVEEGGVLERNYFWDSDRWDDYSGTNLDMYKQYIESDDSPMAADILTVISRGHKWLEEEMGIDLGKVDVQWPADECGASSACYSSYWEHIYISHDRDWRNDTYLHEWGHHLVNLWGSRTDPDYCNPGGWCDDGGCSHCEWCSEADYIAIQEGFPNWLADVIIRDWQDTYLDPPMHTRSQENLALCTTTPEDTWGDPFVTEGFFGALLRDIEDASQDAHDYYPPSAGTKDRLALGIDEIFYVMLGYDEQNNLYFDPTSPLQFLEFFRQRYPNMDQTLWSTAKNCGYDLDDTAPLHPNNLDSSSHMENIPSPNAYVTFTWDMPTDDMSGLHGFSYALTPTTPYTPDTVMDIGLRNNVTLGPLDTGTYYFTIRSKDFDGNWSTYYSTFGPIIIRDPTPVDLAYASMMGWEYPLVPRRDQAATQLDVSVSATLVGDQCCTWWSYAGYNAGEDPVGEDFRVGLYLDNAYFHGYTRSDVLGLQTYQDLNVGGIELPAGRHTMEIRHDSLGQVYEPDESNNSWAHQFVWGAVHMTPDVLTRVSGGIPPPTAGWDKVVDGSATFYNCRGHTMIGTYDWDAVTLTSPEHNNDYDLRLHYLSQGAEDGYESPLALSANGPGMLDAVFVNGNTMMGRGWNLGVVYADGSYAGQYDIQHHTSTELPASGVKTIFLDENESMDLTQVTFGEGVGPFTVTLEQNPDYYAGYVYVGWMVPQAQYSSMNTIHDVQRLGEDGIATFDILSPWAGANCIVIYRNPVENTAPIVLTLTVKPQKPNLLPLESGDWDGAIVPTDAPLSSGPALLPSSLPGDYPSTYFNWAIANLAYNPTTSGDGFEVKVKVDGGTWMVKTAPDLWGGFGYWDFDQFGYTVRGGRHTVALLIDTQDEVPESNEDDNETGAQYVWLPRTMAKNTTSVRGTPSVADGGFEYLPPGNMFLNCDGVRTPDFAPGGKNPMWAAVATLPDPDVSVDLQLHTKSLGPEHGFTAPLAKSSWGLGLSNYVLIDFYHARAPQFDAGVIRDVGSGDYQIQNVGSQALIFDSRIRRYGPFYLEADEIVGLHDLPLDVGGHIIRLVNDHETADLGISLHASGDPYQSKSEALAASWFNEGGEGEYISYDVPVAEEHCIVVWRRNAVESPERVQYWLELEAGLTDTPPLADRRAGIEWVAPNPFNPRVTVAFRLAEEQPVKLEVFDLRGQKVRTLVDGLREAGPHEESWDGVDASGARVASGVYFLRLSTPDLQETRKAVLVK